jgi:hypothetical protein
MDTSTTMPLAQQGFEVVFFGGGLFIASLIVFVVWLVCEIGMLAMVVVCRKGFGLASGILYGVAALVAGVGFAILLSSFSEDGGISSWWLPREGLVARWFETCIAGNAVILGSLAPSAAACIVTVFLGWPRTKK